MARCSPSVVPHRCLLVVVAGLLGGCVAASPDGGVDVREARFALAAGDAPPAAGDSRWRTVTLPDGWDVARRRAGRQGWYRADVELPAAPDAPWAVYLPRVV